ncbi:MAG: purine-nucleoside phosphorylase [Candidatus Krumholzibacteriia bacterium]
MSDGAARLAALSDVWRDDVAAAVDWLRARGFAGRVGLILGSGLGAFADTLPGVRAVPYGEIPGFRTTSVAEHRGRLVAGEAAGVPVIVMQGRLHPYEGLPGAMSLLPTAVLAGLGIGSAVVTNAAGGLNRLYTPGDLMVIREQLDLHLRDPLRGLLRDGPGEAPDGRRPPGAGGPYDVRLARLLVETGAEIGVPLHSGTYASMPGPAYETRAEIGLLRRVGGDAVGMSTAAETVLLARLGVAVVGLSCITNPAREVGQPELSHQDVVEVGNRVRARLERLLLAFLPRLADIGAGS